MWPEDDFWELSDHNKGPPFELAVESLGLLTLFFNLERNMLSFFLNIKKLRKKCIVDNMTDLTWLVF